MDIERLSQEELVALLARVSMALAASQHTGAASCGTAESAPQRYVNPLNHAVSWDGRGRCPNWFRAAMAQGRTPEDLARG